MSLGDFVSLTGFNNRRGDLGDDLGDDLRCDDWRDDWRDDVCVL